MKKVMELKTRVKLVVVVNMGILIGNQVMMIYQ